MAAVTHLVNVLIEKDGISSIGLNVETENTTAIKLYSRIGFVCGVEFREGLFTSREIDKQS